MATRAAIWIAIAVAAVAPTAGAYDPFNEPLCVEGRCVNVIGTCIAGVCLRSCAPAASCRAQVGPDSAWCAVNTSIDGRTCAIQVGAQASRAGVGAAAASVQWSNGSVRASNLENTWFSPGVEASADAAGVDAGTLSAGAYRSDILTEGPRSGPYSRVSPSQNHSWTQIVVIAAYHNGALSQEAVASLTFLDYMPEGCQVRS
ncbi:MAG TPA: hypothetical protein VM582_02060, partial [Candidatus Thermoplasmatota archaeon]|nr:hypothetical protein [Candidatus Thermoplasmatota archaeon]